MRCGASDLGAGPFRRPYELGRLTGLGLVSIYGLAYAIGEIAHFANPKKLVAYLGLNPASAKAEIGTAREFSNVMVAVPFVHCSGKPPRVCCRWKILRATGAWPSPCAAAETRPRLPWPASSPSPPRTFSWAPSYRCPSKSASMAKSSSLPRALGISTASAAWAV